MALLYHTARTAEAERYYIEERELNALGYELLRENNVRAAIEVFRLNVLEFPTSYVVYDSLADAYRAAGSLRIARELYEQSLELNDRRFPWDVEEYEVTQEKLAGLGSG